MGCSESSSNMMITPHSVKNLS